MKLAKTNNSSSPDNATAVVIGPLIANNEYKVTKLVSQTKTVDFYEDWVFSTSK